MKYVLTWSLLVLGQLVCFTTTADDNPNVVFIAVDDLNDWIGCLGGHPQSHTPNINRLAQRGILFTNAHCAAPACNPSRAAVFSGRMPQATGVWANKAVQTLDRTFPESVLLTTVFNDAGYQTLGTGKLMHGGAKATFQQYFSTEQRWSPFPRKAVEYTEAELPSKGSDNPRHLLKDSLGRDVVLPLNRMPSDRAPDQVKGESFDWGPFDVPDSDFGDTRITDWAIEKLATGFEKPFFLGVGYYRPHIPLFAPKRFFDRFEESPGKLPAVKSNDLDDLSDVAKRWAMEPVTAGAHATVVKHKQWQAAVEAYLACVTYVDHEIGRLLNALDNSPYADNTVIALWSDHGWHLGEKQHWGKWTGWERSTRVPMIIAPPKDRKNVFSAGGSRCDQPVGLIDLYPTLIDLCRVSGPGELDGESLVPLLQNPDRKTSRALVTMFDPGNASLRTVHWRYIRYADGSEELYDMQSDPNEWHNLAGDERYSEQKSQLETMLAPYLNK